MMPQNTASTISSFISDFNGDGLLDVLTQPRVEGLELYKNTITGVAFAYGPRTSTGWAKGSKKRYQVTQTLLVLPTLTAKAHVQINAKMVGQKKQMYLWRSVIHI